MTEAERLRADLQNNLLQFNETVGPIFDHADGVRTDLERRGWSPTAAEAAALEVLLSLLRLALRGSAS